MYFSQRLIKPVGFYIPIPQVPEPSSNSPFLAPLFLLNKYFSLTLHYHFSPSSSLPFSFLFPFTVSR